MGHVSTADWNGTVPASAFAVTVGGLFEKQVRLRPHACAVVDGDQRSTFAELDQAVNRWCHHLTGLGVSRGDRVAVLSENRHEYLQVELAAAKIGAIVVCLNGRLVDRELEHCVGLASPTVVVASPDFAATAGRVTNGATPTLVFGADLVQQFASLPSTPPPIRAEPEDGLVILYTSGTTGLPKGAVISHRAMLARLAVFVLLTGATSDDAFLAWAPFFHMASTDHSLITLLLGGTVVVADGPNLTVFSRALEEHTISWLVAIPGMIDRLIDHLRATKPHINGVRTVGAMADLVPRQQLADLTGLLGAPYLNTFGSTEAGLAPACANTLAAGVVPTSLSKQESPFCEIRLVDADDCDVPDEVPGEMLVRGPTLFSGYWAAPDTNAEDFRGGWFHTGDLFVRHEDQTLDFVDRAKYMIKSGGENVYPAEIESQLLSHPEIIDAVVVRKPDQRWGEVPIAFVAVSRPDLRPAEITEHLRGRLASYKLPREIRYVDEAEFPRSTTGKIQRHEVEAWLAP